jgi:muramidase (phage lysozyme)
LLTKAQLGNITDISRHPYKWLVPKSQQEPPKYVTIAGDYQHMKLELAKE